MLLLILDSLGGTELLVILVVALVIFGPRKLPQLSRSLGRSLADFKRATSDFKETWEKEARVADEFREMSIGRAMLPPEESRSTGATVERGSLAGTPPAVAVASHEVDGSPVAAATVEAESAPADDAISAALVQPPSIKPVPAEAALAQTSSSSANPAESPATVEQMRKQDWL